MLHFQATLLFLYASTPSVATGRYTLRNFSCMVITSCKSVTVSDFGAGLVLGWNLLCNDLMACYRCILFFEPNHKHFIGEVKGCTFSLEF